MNNIVVSDNIKIENMIYEIRGKKVMLDSDLVDENGMLSILDCILSTGKYKSKSEIRRLLQQGAVKINGKKTVELLFSPQENMIISVGKGNTFKLMKNKPIVKKIVKI